MTSTGARYVITMYRGYEISARAPVQCQKTSVHNVWACFFETSFNVILTSKLRSSKLLLNFGFYTKTDYFFLPCKARTELPINGVYVTAKWTRYLSNTVNSYERVWCTGWKWFVALFAAAVRLVRSA